MALAIDVVRFVLHRDLRKMRQDLRRATPCSTGARAAAGARLRVFSAEVSFCGGLRLMPVITHGSPLTVTRALLAEGLAGWGRQCR